MLLERLENRVPRLEIAVSWLSNEVNWFFQGVSTF
jgi:archaellum component FlaC